MFDFAKETFDEVSFLIDMFIIMSGIFSVSFGRNKGLQPFSSRFCTKALLSYPLSAMTPATFFHRFKFCSHNLGEQDFFWKIAMRYSPLGASLDI
jgi:hypothetical protein